MQKAVTLYLITLLFLLTKGGDQLYARVHSAAVKSVHSAENAQIAKSSQVLQSLLLSNTGTEIFSDTETDDDEEESFSLKKWLQNDYNFISFLHRIVANHDNHDPLPLPFCEHFSYSCSCKYILQRVIKI